jgi:hypothetical protein
MVTLVPPTGHREGLVLARRGREVGKRREEVLLLLGEAREVRQVDAAREEVLGHDLEEQRARAQAVSA